MTNRFEFSRRAFTLIELLVVISIIGLLSTIATVSLSGSRSKGRDAKRISDLRQIQTALEMYRDNDANGNYPPCNPCSTTGYGTDFTTIGIKTTYMATIPKDPINVSGEYGYYYATQYKKTGDCTFSNPGSNVDYIMATRLENANGVSGSCPGAFGAWNNTHLNYLVGNQ
jgi:prepilin-type N-terminal cleavage/methylation domain-containing protein